MNKKEEGKPKTEKEIQERERGRDLYTHLWTNVYVDIKKSDKCHLRGFPRGEGKALVTN